MSYPPGPGAGYGPPKKSKVPLVLGLVLGAVIVIGGVVAGVLLFSGGDGESSDAAVTSWATSTPSPVSTPSSRPTSDSPTTPGGRIPRTFRLDQDIAPGTCYDVVSSTFDLADAHVVDCAGPHGMELVSTFPLTKPYGNQDDPRAAADLRSCWYDVIAPRVTDDAALFRDSGALIWYPSAAQIAEGQTTGYCVLVADTSRAGSDMLVGSLVAGTYQGAES